MQVNGEFILFWDFEFEAYHARTPRGCRGVLGRLLHPKVSGSKSLMCYRLLYGQFIHGFAVTLIGLPMGDGGIGPRIS